MEQHPQLRFVRALMMHLSDPACLVSPEQRILAVNGPFALHFRKRFGRSVREGATLESGSGASIQDLLPESPHLRAWAKHYWARALAGEPVSSLQHLDDGTILEMHLIPIHDTDGKVLAACQIVRDVSSRRRADQAAAQGPARTELGAELEAPLRYAEVFDTMPYGVLYHDAQGQLLAANPAAERILGATVSELERLLGQEQYWRVIREDGVPLPGLSYPAKVAIQTGTDVHDLVIGLLHPGIESYRWFRVTAVPLFGDSAQPTHVYTLLEDITAQKLTQVSAEGGDHFFRQMADALPHPVMMISGEGAAIYCNLQWQQYTGLDLAGSQHGGWLVNVHPDDTAEVEHQWERAKRLGQASSVKCRLRRQTDGAYRWFRIDFRSLRDVAGQVARRLLIASDIDEQCIAEQALTRATARVEDLKTQHETTRRDRPGEATPPGSGQHNPDTDRAPLPAAHHVWDDLE